MMTPATATMVQVWIENDRIRLRTPFSLKDTVKALPGSRWDKTAKVWHVPATPGAAAAAVAALGQCLDFDDEVLALAEQAALGESIKAAAEGELEGPAMTKMTPWHHQVQGYRMIVDQPATMLAYDMGTGKTKCVVDAVCNIDDCRNTLIVCPKSVIDNWPREFEKHGGVPVTVIPLRVGTLAKRLKAAQQALELARARGEKIALVINYEGVWQGGFGGWVLGEQWGMVVADEIHRIKSPGGKASKFMGKLAKKADRRVGLTGTPMPHSPLDVYGQYRFLDPGIYGTAFTRFRARYALMGGYQNHQVIGYQNEDELNRLFYSIAHRVQKRDVIDLPDVIHETREVDLSAEARTLYEQVESEFIADLGDGQVTAANALSRLLRLQQITSGYAVTDDGEVHNVDTAKSSMLSEILEDLPADEPVVAFCRFRHDLDRVRMVAKSRNRNCMELSGRNYDKYAWTDPDGQPVCLQSLLEANGIMNIAEGMAFIDANGIKLRTDTTGSLHDWQCASGGEVLAVQIQAGGVGIDLTRAAYCVYYSMGYSLGDYEQSLARTDRPGQTRPVTYIHLVGRQTVDQKVYAALQKRADVVEQVLSIMKG